jgi:hypothetical protein
MGQKLDGEIIIYLSKQLFILERKTQTQFHNKKSWHINIKK